MMRKTIGRSLVGWMALALAAGGMSAEAGAETPAPAVLRHAVACPPFKGDESLAKIYHAEMVKLLKEQQV